MLDIDSVWARIKEHEGDIFFTKRGVEFAYEINQSVLNLNMHKGETLDTSQARNLAKSQFAKALQHVPCLGPGDISNLVQGPSYIWAILHDRRIRQSDW